MLKNIIIILLFLLAQKDCLSQIATLSSGADFISESGKISISVGEAICHIEIKNQDTNQRIQPGVQQTHSNFIAEYKIELHQLQIYPNPATSFLNLEFLSEDVDLDKIVYIIYSTDGKRCKEGHISNKIVNSIEIEELPTGKYFIQLPEIKHEPLNFIKI